MQVGTFSLVIGAMTRYHSLFDHQKAGLASFSATTASSGQIIFFGFRGGRIFSARSRREP